MAWTMSSSLSILFLLTVTTISEARDFLVGGSTDGWKIPSDTRESLNKWAEANRFQVGDSLVWKYEEGKDSVLQVTREAYMSCETSSPVREHKDGSTRVGLHRPGAYYFISGVKSACEEGEKLIVVVMSQRQRYGVASPAPAPAEGDGPAVAPTSAVSGASVMIWRMGVLIVLGMVGVLV